MWWNLPAVFDSPWASRWEFYSCAVYFNPSGTMHERRDWKQVAPLRHSLDPPLFEHSSYTAASTAMAAMSWSKPSFLTALEGVRAHVHVVWHVCAGQ